MTGSIVKPSMLCIMRRDPCYAAAGPRPLRRAPGGSIVSSANDPCYAGRSGADREAVSPLPPHVPGARNRGQNPKEAHAEAELALILSGTRHLRTLKLLVPSGLKGAEFPANLHLNGGVSLG